MEISGIYDIPHGAGLAVVFPAWMKYVYKQDLKRFAQFAVRVWNEEPDFNDIEKVALAGIKRLEDFYKRIGLPSTLKEANVHYDMLEEMARKCTERGPAGNFVKLNKDDVLEILMLAR